MLEKYNRFQDGIQQKYWIDRNFRQGYTHQWKTLERYLPSLIDQTKAQPHQNGTCPSLLVIEINLYKNRHKKRRPLHKE